MNIKNFLLKNTRSGFTLIEVVVSTLVFSLAMAGLFSTISSLNRPGVESFEDVQAAYIGKEIIGNLRHFINAEIWDELDPGLYNLVENQSYDLSPVTRDGITYTSNYTVTPAANGGRWVDLTISW